MKSDQVTADREAPLRPVPFVWLPVWLNCTLGLLAWGLLFAWLLVIIPSYQRLLADFGLTLPEGTVLLLAIGDIVKDWAYAFGGLLLAATAADYFGDQLLIRTAQYRLRLLLLALRLIPPIGFVVVSTLLLHWPLMTLMDAFGP